MRTWGYIVCICFAKLCLAQTNIYYPLGNQKYLSNKTTPPSILNCDKVIKPKYRILADNAGKVLLSFGTRVLNTHGDILIPTDSLDPTGNGIYSQAVRLNDSIAAFIYYNEAIKGQLCYTLIDFKFSYGKGQVIKDKSRVLVKTGNIKMMDICRTSDGFYLITSQINDFLYLFKLDDKGVYQTDSLFNPLITGYPDLSKFVPDPRLLANQEFLNVQFSHSGDFLINSIYKYTNVTFPDSIPSIFFNTSNTIIYFDKNTNKFVPAKSQILHSSTYIRNNLFLNVPFNSFYELKLLSPNNKFFYSENHVYNKYPYNGFNKKTDKSQYLQFDIPQKRYVDSVQINYDLNFYNYLSPFHKLNLFISDENQVTTKLSEIDPNIQGLNNSNLKFKQTYNQSIGIDNYPDVYEYAKFKVDINYDCKANVNLTNISDLSGGIDKFKWIITNQNGKNDTLYGFSQKLIYTKNGKYGFKVFASSSISGGYGEWYYDTIEIKIPQKPVANFNADDTVICRYLPLKFKNLSHAKDIKLNTLETYVWTFGDGSPSSSTFEPTHTYTKPGIYTVSLFYSNGYCDSTLVKNQYIQVVDAPKSGFSVENRQGCSPFLANFTDTVTLNVTKREYMFTDSAKWKIINTPKFNYIFNKPGHYWAVQKLYGYTGCIIKTDSVEFFISKGLLLSDSIAITLASFDTLNQLHIEWQSHPAATSYHLYNSLDGINFKLSTNSSQTNIIETSSFNKPLYYKIVASDSCGKLSSAKNTVKPQWINSERLPANEAAIITYKPLEGIGIPQTREIQWTNDYAINLFFGEINPMNPFRDDNFATPNYLKKCYRVMEMHNGVKMYSNYECLNFEPQTFIPNSFTPNGDGLNDKFLPAMMGIVSYDMKIYNRWGELIYSGSTPWNGMVNGNKPAEGEVYLYTLYVIRNDNLGEFHRGTVYLLK